MIPTEPWEDVTIHARSTRVRGVKAAQAEWRPWIANFAHCPALSHYQIIHVGIMETSAPTRIVRTHQTTTYFLSCFEGRGHVLIDGRWRLCAEGCASLLPAHTLNAFAGLKKERWKFCWVCYQQPDDQRPIADVASPVTARFNGEGLRAAIEGLLSEANSFREPRFLQQWVDLIHAYVVRFAKPMQPDDRLRTLWERAASHLGESWTLPRLAREAGYSNEHLRRLCRAQLGRSPMHQVTYLRMRRAAELLATSSRTIEAIAEEVGYKNPFVFSNAFTKWIGWRPSEYRRKQGRKADSSKNRTPGEARTGGRGSK